MTAKGIHEEEIYGKAYDSRLARRLLGYLRPYRGRVALAVAVSGGERQQAFDLETIGGLPGNGPHVSLRQPRQIIVGRTYPLRPEPAQRRDGDLGWRDVAHGAECQPGAGSVQRHGIEHRIAGVEPAPRQRVEYRCADGEQVFVTFSSEAEIPPVWVSKTGKEALLVDGERPVNLNEKAVRTHWDMLLERRSLPELEQILEDRLTILRERRGDAAILGETLAKRRGFKVG